MKIMADGEKIRSLAGAQSGVFSKADLQSTLGEPHPTAFIRRVNKLIEQGGIERFCRGWYVVEPFELAVLSQRIAPDSYISFGTALAETGIIGTKAGTRIIAAKTGTARKYQMDRYSIEHVTLNESLHFGITNMSGVNYADAEKAVLDTLYFHLRGRKFAFDIYSDLDWSRIKLKKVRGYLRRYKNPKFIAFVEGMITEL